MTRTVLARVARDVVVVSGPDATTFLQSLLSQDLDPVAIGGATHSLLLEPRGKLVVDLRAARVADTEWWCLCEPGFGSVLAGGLKRFRIRVKVEIDDRSTELDSFAVRGPDSSALVAAALAASAGDAPGAIAVPVDWPDAAGFDVVGEPAEIAVIAGAVIHGGAVEISADDHEAMRIEAGVPRQGFDIDETTIAQEAYLERDAVSFTKGCFLGQELVCRIDSRGRVNRLLRRLRADAPLTRGATVLADGKEVGAVTSASGTIALATLRHEVEPATTVLVHSEAGDIAAVVEAVAENGAE